MVAGNWTWLLTESPSDELAESLQETMAGQVLVQRQGMGEGSFRSGQQRQGMEEGSRQSRGRERMEEGNRGRGGRSEHRTGAEADRRGSKQESTSDRFEAGNAG